MQEHTLNNGFVASFNASTCKFKLEKYTDCKQSTLLFESDDQLLQVGMGDVDSIVIMKNGNVAQFPAVQTRSYNITCREAVTTPDTFAWTGQIILN